MKLRIFLTGSTSYLGTMFIDRFGHQFDIMGIARSDPLRPIDLLDFKTVERLYLDFQPDVILHTAADLGRDNSSSARILQTNPAITQNLLGLAALNSAAFIFTSTEAVYGGREQSGAYIEEDNYKPRSLYGQSKVLSEQAIRESGLPWLITRAHRYVGVSPRFSKPKQFPDTIRALSAGKTVHLDANKLFKPVLLDTLCDVLVHYIERDRDQKVLINVGIDRATTYYELISQIALSAGINRKLIEPDGEETGWPLNSTLSVDKARKLGYPETSWEEMLASISNGLSLSV